AAEDNAQDGGSGNEDPGERVGCVQAGAQRFAFGSGHGEAHGEHGQDQERAYPVQRLLGAGVGVGGGGRLLHGSSRSFAWLVAGSASRLVISCASVLSKRSAS